MEEHLQDSPRTRLGQAGSSAFCWGDSSAGSLCRLPAAGLQAVRLGGRSLRRTEHHCRSMTWGSPLPVAWAEVGGGKSRRTSRQVLGYRDLGIVLTLQQPTRHTESLNEEIALSGTFFFLLKDF